MTQHKLLQEMVETAQVKGFSKRANYMVEYRVTSLNTSTDLEFKKIEDKLSLYNVYHYGTRILEIEEAGNLYTGYRYTIGYVYGKSYSDAKAINALLDYFGIGGTRYTYKPVNGGFQATH